MCGIVGYTGEQNATSILLEGLARLEYRGYDSAGIAVLSHEGKLQVRRAVGNLSSLRTAVATVEPEGTLGIGHTRWATHGRPSDENAHPHRDCTGEVTVVHNGIIENYASLRDELQRAGHTFLSETDTEVLAHLLEETLRSAPTLADAVRAALKRVTGSYAIAVASSRFPREIVGARLNGPLIVGLGEHENFIASDIPAILRHTRRVIILEEAEVASVTPDRVTITTLDGQEITREPIEVTWDAEAAEKGGHPHFFVKEIYEQPHALRRAFQGRIQRAAEDHDYTLHLEALDRLRERGALDTLRRVVIVGCGTSVHAGYLAKYAIERWSRVPVEVAIASEYRYSDPIVGPDTLCIAVTQSGETADTLAATRLAREMGAPIVAVTNVVGSAITRVADAVLYLQAGPEISVTATKTFVTMEAVLQMIGLWLGEFTGKLAPAERAQALTALTALPGQMEGVLTALGDDPDVTATVERVAKRLSGSQSCMFIGRGPGYPLAMEGALKLKEISYVHAEAYAAGELKHGPIALLSEAVPLLADATASHTYDKVISNIQEVRARGAHVIALATEGDTGIGLHAEDVFFLPATPEVLAPILAIVPLQLVAYHVALLLGRNVDQPRNLAKSVTVE